MTNIAQIMRFEIPGYSGIPSLSRGEVSSSDQYVCFTNEVQTGPVSHFVSWYGGLVVYVTLPVNAV
jgi:hypothetical protein